MQQISDGVLQGSSIYFQNAAAETKNIFFYLLCIGSFICSPVYSVKRQSYDSFLLLYVTDGEGTIETQGSVTSISKGQVAFLDCYQPHSYYTRTGWNILWMHIDGPVCRSYYDKITQSNGSVITLDDIHAKKQFSFIFINILQSYSAQAPYPDAILSKYITDMLTFLFHQDMGGLSRISYATPLDMALSYIQTHFNEPVQIDELASQASLSSFHFIRLFKKETGQTPHQYLIQMRINSAKFYLRTTDAAIKEIAFQCGFQSENNFCICFKKTTGITPGEYRKQK